MDPTSNRRITQQLNDAQALRRRAQEVQPQLNDELQRLVSDLEGAEIVGTRIKDEVGLQQKIEQGRPPQTVSDYLGARVAVSDVETLYALRDRIRQRFDTVELEDFLGEGKMGYRAVHVQSEVAEGFSAEIQLVPRQIAEIQEDVHQIYDKWKRVTRLSAEQRAEYEQDLARATEQFDAAYDDFLAESQRREAERLASLEVPVGERVDPDTGQTVAETRTVQDLFDEADEDARFADEVEACAQ